MTDNTNQELPASLASAIRRYGNTEYSVAQGKLPHQQGLDRMDDLEAAILKDRQSEYERGVKDCVKIVNFEYNNERAIQQMNALLKELEQGQSTNLSGEKVARFSNDINVAAQPVPGVESHKTCIELINAEMRDRRAVEIQLSALRGKIRGILDRPDLELDRRLFLIRKELEPPQPTTPQ